MPKKDTQEKGQEGRKSQVFHIFSHVDNEHRKTLNLYDGLLVSKYSLSTEFRRPAGLFTRRRSKLFSLLSFHPLN